MTQEIYEIDKIMQISHRLTWKTDNNSKFSLKNTGN